MDNLDGGKESANRKTKIMRTRYLLSLLLFFNITFVVGQNLAQHNWYFGTTNNALRFNRGNNKAQAITLPAPFVPLGTGGSAVATDPATGDLLFYSDGVNVYDACYKKMKDPSGNPHFPLSGNSAANQPVVFCPVPGQAQKYYVFTNDAAGTIRWVIVDLALQGWAIFPVLTGEISSSSELTMGLSGRSEGMIIIPHSNGNDYWLVTHQNNSAIFSATLINNATFTSGLFTTTSNPAPGLGNPTGISISVSNFSYNHKLKKLAVSVQSPGDDALIVDFDPATGFTTFDRYIFNTGVASATMASVYDIQWDVKGGQYLYISRTGEPGIPADVLQYDYTGSLPGVPSTIISSIYSAPTIAQSYGLHLAPDSAIYHIYQAIPVGPFLVEKLTKIDTIALEVIKTPLPFGNIDFSGKQFPSFLPKSKVNLTVNFTTAPDPVANPSDKLCQNNKITFLPDVSPNADSLVWDFGDGTPPSKEWSPVHTFAMANATTGFQVTLTAFYQGQKQVAPPKSIKIDAFDFKIQLNMEETACECELPINLVKCGGVLTPKAFEVKLQATGSAASGASYVWSNGDTGDTLTPDESGYYYVVATVGGCSTYAGVNVKQYGLSDQRSNIWYFGDKAGIDFNPVTPLLPPSAKPISTSAMTAPEGCAIVCDRNGDVIFYTDGKNVYDKTNTLIPILPSGLAGDVLSTQSSLIVPVPGDETLYYIFTTQESPGGGTNEIRYSIFDLKQNAGKGLVTQKNILLFSKSTERITANGQWLIAHEYGNSTFRSYKITAQGIGEAVYSDIGSVHSFKNAQSGQGYMKLGPGPKDNLAVALSTGTENLVELFHLNDTTGVLNNYQKIVLPQATGQVYGVEFSSNGRRLFATINGAPSNIFEYFLDDKDILPPAIVPNPALTIPAGIKLGALQMGPDGRIYMAQDNSAFLGTIDANGGTTPPLNPSNITFDSFDLKGPKSALGLPNFIQQQGNSISGPAASVPPKSCVGQEVSFTGTPTDATIDKFDWNYFDSSGNRVGGSTDPSPSFTFTTADTYKIIMTLSNKCLPSPFFTSTNFIEISDPPAKPTDLIKSICTTPSVILDATAGILTGRSYLWTTTETTPTISVSRKGKVSVTITDTDPLKPGCTSKVDFTVTDSRPIVDLGPDRPLCEGETPPILNAKNSTASFQWKLNGAIIIPNPTPPNRQPVDTTLPLTLPLSRNYEVTVTDLLGCKKTDDITFTINVLPVFAYNKIDPTNCTSTDGSVAINFSVPAQSGGPYTYSVFGQGGLTSKFVAGFDQPAGSTTGPLAGFSTGTFSITVTDQVSGCSDLKVDKLDAPSFTADASLSVCDPSNVVVTILTGSPAPPLSYTFTNTATGLAIGPPQPLPSALLPAASYIIQVKDNTGCAFSFNKTVPPFSATVTITPSLCPIPTTSPATLTASISSGTVILYTWTLPDGITKRTGQVLTVANTGGSGRYTVEADLGGGCKLSQTTDIVYNGPLAPDFSQAPLSGCATQVTLAATPVGSYTYRWYKIISSSPVLQPSMLGPQVVLSLGQEGDYLVEVVDPLNVNACVVPSATKPVLINGPVDVRLLPQPPICADGTPFTIKSSTSIPPAGITYSWTLDGKPLTGEINSTLTVTNPTQQGTYEITLSRGTGTKKCEAKDKASITRNPLPVGKLPIRAIICDDPENEDEKTNQIKLEPGIFTTYNWFYKTDDKSTRAPLGFATPTFTAKRAGIFLVDITDILGCSNTAQTEVLTECIPKIIGPNAFRPNSAVAAYSNNLGSNKGTYSNQEFFVYSFFVADSDFEIAIFNRWGEIVYESKNKDFRWNGGLGGNFGQPLPGGTYAYVIRYKSSYRPQDGVKEQRGGVVLLR